jgi:hypothetical protein
MRPTPAGAGAGGGGGAGAGGDVHDVHSSTLVLALIAAEERRVRRDVMRPCRPATAAAAAAPPPPGPQKPPPPAEDLDPGPLRADARAAWDELQASLSDYAGALRRGGEPGVHDRAFFRALRSALVLAVAERGFVERSTRVLGVFAWYGSRKPDRWRWAPRAESGFSPLRQDLVRTPLRDLLPPPAPPLPAAAAAAAAARPASSRPRGAPPPPGLPVEYPFGLQPTLLHPGSPRTRPSSAPAAWRAPPPGGHAGAHARHHELAGREALLGQRISEDVARAEHHRARVEEEIARRQEALAATGPPSPRGPHSASTGRPPSVPLLRLTAPLSAARALLLSKQAYTADAVSECDRVSARFLSSSGRSLARVDMARVLVPPQDTPFALAAAALPKPGARLLSAAAGPKAARKKSPGRPSPGRRR